MRRAPNWRRATPADAVAISTLSKDILGDLGEGEAVFAERIALAPDGCHVLEDGDGIAGHMISHPWLRGQPPALNALLERLPERPDCWYIHDFVLAPEARGAGAATHMIDVIAAVAREAKLPVLALVAVNGAEAFWVRQGFAAVPVGGLASYDAASVYMERAA